MGQPALHSKSGFYCIGTSYKKADAETRGYFSLSEESRENLLRDAKANGIPSLIAISTCNRTELYGFAERPGILVRLLCEHTKGTIAEFQKSAYVYQEEEARQHLFMVGTGLDSQILGDFEIIGQIKAAYRKSKQYKLVNPYMERLGNSVLQASKRIKTETEISSGATSVSFASVQYILDNYERGQEQRILLFGTGKIGRNTCENLVKHTQNKSITLINRTRDRAEDIAGKFNVRYRDFADLEEEIAQTDILIVATGAQRPTVSRQLICTQRPLLILDLSIPHNVDEDVRTLPNVKLVQLDALSRMTDAALKSREQFVPAAKNIVDEIHADFNKWLESRTFAPTMQALKEKLTKFKQAEIKSNRTKISDFNAEQADLLGDRLIQKIAGHIANHLREEDSDTDEAIAILHRVFKLDKIDG